MIISVTETTFPQEVLQSSRLVLVNFWAPWCGLCRLISPVLNQFQQNWDGEVKLVGINADENFRLANYYQLTTLPTLLLIEDGRIIERIEGFQGRDDLAKRLNAVMLNKRMIHSA